MTLVLRAGPSPDDTEWVFNVRLPPPPKRPGMGVHVAFTAEAIRLDWTLFPANRILQSDDTTKFVLASFDGLRFPNRPPSTNRDYKLRFFKAGLHLNGVEYRFYGHSNRQLVRSWTVDIGHECLTLAIAFRQLLPQGWNRSRARTTHQQLRRVWEDQERCKMCAPTHSLPHSS